jgi:RNA polymerase-binding transcription factor DksA
MARGLAARDVKRYETTLRALHRRLLGDLEELEEAALGSADSPVEGQGDEGSQEQVEAMDLELIEEEDVTAHEVSLALKRIHGGTFGTCLDCGRAIARGRLDALPWTRFCIDCATDRED